MHIRTLHLANFRNFHKLAIELRYNRNVILGDNGQGKTNILEAIHILGVGRSHRERRESNLIKFGESFYRITGVFDHIGVRTTIEVIYSEDGKKIRINGKEAHPAQLVGLAAVVITAPDDIELVKGSPAARRRFLDIAISQTSREYLKALQEYSRALAQRNTILKAGRGSLDQELDAWDAVIVEVGSKIVEARHEFLKDILAQVQNNFSRISGRSVRVGLHYEPKHYILSDVTDVRSELKRVLTGNRSYDIERGYTTCGPHLDDFKFTYDGADIRLFGSEGEQRTAVLALRCAEVTYLTEKLGRPPIVLLDDVFAELDDTRSSALIALISDFDQIILTSSRRSPLPAEDVGVIELRGGGVWYVS